jgi:hypothetical protein
LQKISEQIDRTAWAVLWYRLLFEETDLAVALRLDVLSRAVHRLFQNALKAVAALQ